MRQGDPPERRTRLGAVPDTALVRRARKIDRVLAETYPDARCELDFDNPF
jgi:endonuclease III